MTMTNFSKFYKDLQKYQYQGSMLFFVFNSKGIIYLTLHLSACCITKYLLYHVYRVWRNISMKFPPYSWCGYAYIFSGHAVSV